MPAGCQAPPQSQRIGAPNERDFRNASFDPPIQLTDYFAPRQVDHSSVNKQDSPHISILYKIT